MAESKSNALEVSVTELSAKLKRTVEDAFGHVRVRGEISGYRGPHSSGHSYFSLKDDRARLEAVIWRGQAAKLKHKPEEGLEVIASGKLTTYPGSSKYQLVIDQIEPAGAGALMALLEERRRKLQAEGLFAEERKRPLPFMPRVIGVITSPTGAVIRDILHRITDRFPVHVIVWPVRVQGETSGREVANGVRRMNDEAERAGLPRPDVLIVARGGGSLEDLWGFNDEELVRAVAGSTIPVISAVGHETDWTLIDHAADRRAPTPTAAAEMAVPVKADLEAQIAKDLARLRQASGRLARQRADALRSAARPLKNADALLAMPRRRFDEASSRLARSLVVSSERSRTRNDHIASRLHPRLLRSIVTRKSEAFASKTGRHGPSLERAFGKKRNALLAAASLIRPPRLDLRRHRLTATGNQLTSKLVSSRIEQFGSTLERRSQDLDRAQRDRKRDAANRLQQQTKLLDSLSYTKVMKRGYAVIRDPKRRVIDTVSGIAANKPFTVEMHDGSRDAVALPGKDAPIAAKKTATPTKRRTAGQDNQGQLF